MSFLDFSDTQYVKTVDTGEEIRIGSFYPSKNMELKYMRLTMFVDGAIPTTEEVKVNLYSDEGYTSLLLSSSWSKLSDITNLTSSWIGWIRVEFIRYPLNSKIEYFPTIELRNYTRSPSYYIGFCYDFPFPIYDNSETLFYKHPLQFQLFGMVDRRYQ